MNRQNIYGIEVFSSEKEALLKEIEHRLAQDKKFTVMSVNPEILMAAERTPVIKQTLQHSEINIPDGIGTIILAKKHGKKIKERIAGYDLYKDLCRLASEKQKSIFLYGAEQWVVEKAAENLKKEFPSLRIAGIENGFVKNRHEVVQRINESKADFLFVAMGAPHQELFIREYLEELTPQLIQPVGGSFDVTAGKVKRAPGWAQKMNVEWLYRLLTDIKRTKRIAKMLMFVGKEMIKGRRAYE